MHIFNLLDFFIKAIWHMSVITHSEKNTHLQSLCKRWTAPEETVGCSLFWLLEKCGWLWSGTGLSTQAAAHFTFSQFWQEHSYCTFQAQFVSMYFYIVHRVPLIISQWHVSVCTYCLVSCEIILFLLTVLRICVAVIQVQGINGKTL